MPWLKSSIELPTTLNTVAVLPQSRTPRFVRSPVTCNVPPWSRYTPLLAIVRLAAGFKPPVCWKSLAAVDPLPMVSSGPVSVPELSVYEP